MTAAHTPGPWTLREYDTDRCTKLVGVFCGQRTAPIVESVYGGTLAESDANAALIAAAPDLLEACRAALALLQDADAEAADADRVADKLALALDRVRP